MRSFTERERKTHTIKINMESETSCRAQLICSFFVFVKMLKSRIRIDFNYYSLMNDLGKFSSIWCHKDVLCSVVENNLIFKSVDLM